MFNSMSTGCFLDSFFKIFFNRLMLRTWNKLMNTVKLKIKRMTYKIGRALHSFVLLSPQC